MLAIVGSCVLPGAVASAAPLPTAEAPPGTSEPGASDRPQPALNTFIDPDLLESVQPSIVGVVTIWEEPESSVPAGPPGAVAAAEPARVISTCTGWFDTPETIVTAGHCVDPEQGRTALDNLLGPPVDPTTGQPLPAPPVRPEPERTVWAFQPREMQGAVLTSPVKVRVDSFRPVDEGDTAKLQMYGMPPAKPLPVAPAPPRVGETVTSIGFPWINIEQTDGVNLEAEGNGKTPAEVLQDSRLQPVNTSGTITAKQYRDGFSVYQINADLGEGISGGPTINSRGEVYGVNSEMSAPFGAQNFNVITDTGMLREFLGLTPAQPAAAPQSRLAAGSSPLEGGLPTEWTVVIAMIGGAIVGGLVVWVYVRPRPRSSTAKPAEVREESS